MPRSKQNVHAYSMRLLGRKVQIVPTVEMAIDNVRRMYRPNFSRCGISPSNSFR